MRTAVACALCLIGSAPAFAQQAGADSVASAYIDAKLNGRALEAAKFVHPDVRDKVGEAVLVLASVGEGELPIPPLIQTEDKPGYEGLTAAEAYARFYRSLDERNEAARASRGGYSPTYEVERLGPVVEGDTTHVLFRTRMALAPGRVEERFEVVSLRPSAEGWGVLPAEYEAGALVSLAEIVVEMRSGAVGPPPPPDRN